MLLAGATPAPQTIVPGISLGVRRLFWVQETGEFDPPIPDKITEPAYEMGFPKKCYVAVTEMKHE